MNRTMTGQDVAEAVVELIADSVAALNLEAGLLEGWFQFSARPMSGGPDAYVFIKPYDPLKVTEGLTVAVIAGTDRVLQRFLPNAAEREVPVTVAVYLLGDGCKYPDLVRRAKAGSIRALSALLMGRRALATTAGELYDIRVEDRAYGLGLKVQQGDFVVQVATLSLTARFLAQE